MKIKVNLNFKKNLILLKYNKFYKIQIIVYLMIIKTNLIMKLYRLINLKKKKNFYLKKKTHLTI